MPETQKILVALGLTPTEAEVYMAGIKFESVTVVDIAKATKVKRPTIYHALTKLQERGLCAEKRTGTKLRFFMSPPHTLKVLLEARRQQIAAHELLLADLVPHLTAQQKKLKEGEVSVVHYSGIEGMKMVMDIAFYCRSKRWDIIAPFSNFLREYDPEYAKQYLQARKYHGITSRTLWEPAEAASGDSAYSTRPLTKEEIYERDPRLMPWVMHKKFKSMMILFDDKVAIFSPYEKLSAMLITSKDMHEMFSAMFEGIWEFSESY